MEQWIVSILVSIACGGLGGSIYNQWVTTRGAVRKAKEKQLATIAALIFELRLAYSICETNGRLKETPLPTFRHLPTTVATRVIFAERDSYPLLNLLHPDIEQYVLTATSLNESIDMYLHTLLMPPPFPVTEELRNEICDISIGSKRFYRIASNVVFTLPEFINTLINNLVPLSKRL